MAKKRVKTGIKGFDRLVDGGFPMGSTVLYTGTPGTGKTIFGLEYLINGWKKYKEKGLFVSLEETEDDLFEQASQFGWNLKALHKQGAVCVMAIPSKNINNQTSSDIMQRIKKDKFKRLVVDSLSTLSVNAPIFEVAQRLNVKEIMNNNTFLSPPVVGDLMVKRFIYGFIDDLRVIKGVTTILISENSEHADFLSRDTISEFLCDGVIVVNFESIGGDFARHLLVRKMRQTKNDENQHPLEIGKKGLVVHEVS